MLDEFDRRQSRLVSVSEGLDSSKGGRVVFAILSERAREEAKDMAKRAKIGHDSHKAEGRRGTGRPPFGLHSALAAHDDFALLIAQGLTVPFPTVQHVAVLVRPASPDRDHAREERRLGQLAHRRGRPPAAPGGVTPAEWFTIKALIAERTDDRWAKGKPEAKYLGTGSYRCGRLRDKKGTGELEPCGGSMSHRGGRYRCEVRQTRGKSICEGVVTLADRIDHAVGQAWIHHITALEPGDPVVIEMGRRWLAFADPETQAKKDEVRKDLEAAQRRVEKLEDDFYVYGKMDEERFEELSEGQRAVIESTTATLEALEAEADLSPFTQVATLRAAWEVADMGDKRILLRCALGEKGVLVKPAARQGDHTPILERLVFDWWAKPGTATGW